jgi:anthranilate phosphoribosyltransferase
VIPHQILNKIVRHKEQEVALGTFTKGVALAKDILQSGAVWMKLEQLV